MPKISYPIFAFPGIPSLVPVIGATPEYFVQWRAFFDGMNDKQLPKLVLVVASWWVTAVVVGYFVTNVLGSRTVLTMLRKW